MPDKSPRSRLAPLVKMANKVAEMAVLQTVRLKRSRLSNGVDLGESVRVSPKYSLGIQLRVSKRSAQFAVMVELNSGGYKETDSTQEPTAFVCVPTFELLYALPKKSAVSEAALKAFAQIKAPADAWPYVREYCHSTMNWMGLPNFVLDPFKPERFWKFNGDGAQPRRNGRLHPRRRG